MKPPHGMLPFALAAAAACAACTLVIRAGEVRVAQHDDAAAHLRAAIAADEALADARVQVESRHRVLALAVQRFSRPLDATARVASFVRDAARICAAHRTQIAAIVPVAPVGAPVRDSRSGAVHRAIAFDVTLDGGYADVLAAVRGLSSLTLPAEIAISSIARKNPNAPDTSVRGALRITLHDLASPDAAE